MPPRKRHPRSLDALFPAKPRPLRLRLPPPPKPRPEPTPQLLCGRGHPQSRGWTPGRGCQRCAKLAADDKLAKEMAAKAKERPRESVWPGGRVPDVLTMRVHDTGQILRFAIPKHLRRRKRRGI